MKRTQIQLEDEIYERFRRIAFQERRSVASLIRDILRAWLKPSADPKRSRPRFTFVGAGRSGRADLSERHDEALGEDFR